MTVAIVLAATLGRVESADAWQVASTNKGSVAVSPSQHIRLEAMESPESGVWGVMYVPIKQAQLEPLRSQRFDKYFSFVPVIVDIDGFQRQINAQVDEKALLVKIDMDLNSWDDMKRGNVMKITLPDGSSQLESLMGSRDALKILENRRSPKASKAPSPTP